jgi:hypothetical protein
MAFTQAYGISLMTAYTGPDELSHYTVNDNLESYFREQVFGHNRPSGNAPYMIRSAYTMGSEFIEAPSQPETFITFYREKIVDLSKHSSTTNNEVSSKRSMDGVTSVLLVVTDVNLYIVLDDFNPNIKFFDAPVPILLRSHAIDTLRYINAISIHILL